MTRRLPAPTQINDARAGGTVLAVQNGDLHVYHEPPSYQVERFPPGPASSVAANTRPLALLSADNQVVSFYGRERELADLEAWRDDVHVGASVLLIHGRAGQGKSRLAARLAEVSATDGWTVSRVRRDAFLQRHSATALAIPDERRGHLVVVDYAERWPVDELCRLLLDRRLHGDGALRFLLLARPAGGWWRALRHRLMQSVGMSCRDLTLTGLGRNPNDRRQVFREARDRFASVLGVGDVTRIELPDSLEHESRDLVLALHMAALALVLAHAEGHTPAGEAASLSAYLLDRERSHWQLMYDNNRRVETRPAVLARAVQVASMTRSLPYADAEALLIRVGVASATDPAGRILDDHGLCYPAVDHGRVLEPLYPDRLAEDFVALQSPGHDVRDYPADPWASHLATRLIGGAERGEVTKLAPRTLSLLIEASSRWPHLAERELFPLLRDQPGLALLAGSAGLTALIGLPGVPFDVLVGVEEVIPIDPGRNLYPGVAALTERLVEAMQRNGGDSRRRALLSDKLVQRLLFAGRVPEARLLGERAVRSWRASGDTVRLAGALTRLGMILVELREWKDAKEVLSEAWRQWRRLTGDDARRYDVDRVTCLECLATALSATGDAKQANKVRDQAARLLRSLAPAGSGGQQRLAGCLTDYASQLRDQGLNTASLARIDEALPIWRDLVQRHPSRYRAGLATSLMLRGRVYRALDEALAARRDVEEAITILRSLTDVSIAHDEQYAEALALYSLFLDKPEDAEARVSNLIARVAVYRRLASVKPHVRPRLAVAQILFGEACLETRRHMAEGLQTVLEAIITLRTLTPEQRDKVPVPDSRPEQCIIGLLYAAGRRTEADRLAQYVDRRNAAGKVDPETDLGPPSERLVLRLAAQGQFHKALDTLSRMPVATAGRLVARMGPFFVHQMSSRGTSLPAEVLAEAQRIDPMSFALFDQLLKKRSPPRPWRPQEPRR